MTKKITKENVSEELLKSIKKATIQTKKKKKKKNYNLSLDRIGVGMQNLEDAVISIKHNEEIIKM